MNVKYGNFTLTIDIINVDENSRSNCLPFIFQGGFGTIYKGNMNNVDIAIKRI